MLKNQVEPRAAGEWFHCQVFDILWRRFVFYNNKDKLRAELAFLSDEKALHLTSFLLSVLL